MVDQGPEKKAIIAGVRDSHLLIAVTIGLGAGIIMLSGTRVKPAAQALPPAPPPVVSKLTEGDVAGWYRGLIAKGKPCEDAAEILQKHFAAMAAGGGSRFKAFDAAKATEEICRADWSAMREVEPPKGLTAAGRNTAKEVVERCSSSAFSRKRLAEGVQIVLDGDYRPSAVAEVRERGDQVTRNVLGCASGIFKLGSDQGFETTRFVEAVTGEPAASKSK